MLNVDFSEIEARFMAAEQSVGRLGRDFSKKVKLAQAYGMGRARLNAMWHTNYIKIIGTVEDWYRLQAFVALAPGLHLMELRPKPAGKRKQLIGKVMCVANPGAAFTIMRPRTHHEHTLDEFIALVEPLTAGRPTFVIGSPGQVDFLTGNSTGQI